MKLICTTCRTFKKKKETKIYRELVRLGTSNMHIPSYYRICNKCLNEIYDSKLENKNIRTYVRQYKLTQKYQKAEVKHGK